MQTEFDFTQQLAHLKELRTQFTLSVEQYDDLHALLIDLQQSSDDDLESVLEQRDSVYFLIEQFEQLTAQDKVKLALLLTSFISNYNQQNKQLLEFILFCVLWFVIVAESGQGQKSVNKKQSSSGWSWDNQKVEILQFLTELLQKDTITTTASISSMVDLCVVLYELESNLKITGLKLASYQLIEVCVERHQCAQQVSQAVLQQLRYCTHLADILADMVIYLVAQNQNVQVLTLVLQEIGQQIFQSDDKASKEYARFLTRISGNQQVCGELVVLLPSFAQLMDSESYTIRCAMIECLGLIMSKHLVADTKLAYQLVALCKVLETRIYDISSYCRARVFKTFAQLCDVPDGPKHRRNAIPLARRQNVIHEALLRLHDKAANVRKEVIRFLCIVVDSHPFWLDGGQLDLKFFEEQLQLVQEKLDSIIEEDVPDFINELEDALPEIAKELLKQDRKESPKQAQAGGLQLSLADQEQLQIKRQYYQDAVDFVHAVNDAACVMEQLLYSKSKSDVVESIQFFVEAYQAGLPTAQQAIMQIIHLVWSKDKGDMESRSVREHVVQSFVQVYIDAPEHEHVVIGLLKLVCNCTIADLTSIEQVLAIVMEKKLLSKEVVKKLWLIFESSDTQADDRRGALCLISMIASSDDVQLKKRVDLIVDIGLGFYGIKDCSLAYFACKALLKLVPQKTTGSSIVNQAYRFSVNHPMFQKMKSLLCRESPSVEYFALAEQIINTVYLLSVQPDLLLTNWINKMSSQVFNDHTQDVKVFTVARLIFVAGHAAVNQVGHLERIEAIFNQAISVPKESQDGKGNDLDQVVGSAEDEIGDYLLSVRSEELLYGSRSLLSVFGKMVVILCSQTNQNWLLLRVATLTLCKFMVISDSYCEQHLSLLLKLLQDSQDVDLTANIVIALGDLIVSQNSIMDRNINFLYTSIQSKHLKVRRNALMVLTHLILNGMVKLKGQVGEIAKCIVDDDQGISDLARMFFTELSGKDNAVYNNLTDIVSTLSVSSQGVELVSESKFQAIMRFLLQFIDKERQNENIVEKLCLRFRYAASDREQHDLAMCLSLLPFTSERSFKRLTEHFSVYKEALSQIEVYKCLMDIVYRMKKASKSAESKSSVEDYELKLQEAHHIKSDDVEVQCKAQLAIDAVDADNSSVKITLAQQSDSLTVQVEQLRLATPVKGATCLGKISITSKVAPSTRTKVQKQIATPYVDDADDIENAQQAVKKTSRKAVKKPVSTALPASTRTTRLRNATAKK